jgi:hypothetical protein
MPTDLFSSHSFENRDNKQSWIRWSVLIERVDGRDRDRDGEELAGSARGEKHDEGTRSNTLRAVWWEQQWWEGGGSSRCFCAAYGFWNPLLCELEEIYNYNYN